MGRRCYTAGQGLITGITLVVTVGINVVTLISFLSARAFLPVLICVGFPIAVAVGRCRACESFKSGFYLSFCEILSASRAMIVCCYACYKLCLRMLFSNSRNESTVIVRSFDLTCACFPCCKVCDLICTIRLCIELTARALVITVPTGDSAGSTLAELLYTIAVSVRKGSVVIAGFTGYVVSVIVNVIVFLGLKSTRAFLPVLIIVCLPITVAVRRSFTSKCLKRSFHLAGGKVFITNGALVVSRYACYKLGLCMLFSNCIN